MILCGTVNSVNDHSVFSNAVTTALLKTWIFYRKGHQGLSCNLDIWTFCLTIHWIVVIDFSPDQSGWPTVTLKSCFLYRSKDLFSFEDLLVIIMKVEGLKAFSTKQWNLLFSVFIKRQKATKADHKVSFRLLSWRYADHSWATTLTA